MENDRENIKNISAIYKLAYREPGIIRNSMKKTLLSKGKISSPEKFNKTLQSLLALGLIVVEKDRIKLPQNLIQTGILKKNKADFVISLANSKKQYKIDKSIASGYRCGDYIDVIINYFDNKKEIFILGKSKTPFQVRSSRFSKETNKKADEKSIQIDPDKDGKLLLGRVVKTSHDNLVFIPNNKKLPLRQIPILNDKEEFSTFQDKICIMELENPSVLGFGGKIISVKGNAGNPIHEFDAIAENYGAIMSWDDKNDRQLQDEIYAIPTKINANSMRLIDESQAESYQKNNIVDLRHLMFVTVDPENCKDMDDAIYSTIDEDGNTVCYTAVANVTKYVDINSEIWDRYVNAGFTIYAPNKAYNILPSKLASGICSLNPNEDRLAFVIKSTIDSLTGLVKENKIYDAVICSKQKYSYEEAQNIVDKFNFEDAQNYVEYLLKNGETLQPEEQILMNYFAAQKIKNGFEQRKMIQFSYSKDLNVTFDKDMQDIIDIKKTPHLLYHDVIESFMIIANEATAKYANENGINNIYRVHDKPTSTKNDKIDEFFKVLGIEYNGDLSTENIRSIIDLTKNTIYEEEVNKFLIKIQSRAIYSQDLYPKDFEITQNSVGKKISHYALQSENYSHTTSPIRRVPDFITQYNILANMHDTEPIPASKIENIVKIINERQIQVEKAEKDFDTVSSVIYCEKHIGEQMKGYVTRIRLAAQEEELDDEIIAIIRNEEKGIEAEIPLHQIIGKGSNGCYLSEHNCAVYDANGNIVLTICEPIDFIIDKADRKTMTIIGKTNKTLVECAEKRENLYKKRFKSQSYIKHKDKKFRKVNSSNLETNQNESPDFTN